MVQHFQSRIIISWYEPIRNGVRRPVVSRGLNIKLKEITIYVLCSGPRQGLCPPVGSTVGRCINFCRQDVQCQGNHKCCYNGCGYECKQPGK